MALKTGGTKLIGPPPKKKTPKVISPAMRARRRAKKQARLATIARRAKRAEKRRAGGTAAKVPIRVINRGGLFNVGRTRIVPAPGRPKPSIKKRVFRRKSLSSTTRKISR